jgi:gliding motility-associated-like protein
VELIPYPGYGCKDTLEVNLQDTLTATANAGPDIASCNFNPVRLGISPVGGMVYNWSPSYGLNDPTVSNPFALPASDTTYILSIQSMGGGCLSKDTVKVFTRNIDNSLELIGEQRYCLGNGPNPVLRVLPVNSVQWYRNDLPIPGATQLSYTVYSSGSYSASLLSDICTDPIRTRSIDMIIDTALAGMTYPPIDVAFNFPIRLHARGIDFANSVLWMPNTNLDDAHSFEPYFKGLHEQLYTIEIKTLTGCVTIDTQLVKTHKEIAIYVPTVFTPGGDGTNDYLRPLLLGFEKLKYFRIFNRWGKKIYETQTDLPGWDGRIGNILQETQTVIWMIEAVDIDGKTHFKKGSTLLIR